MIERTRQIGTAPYRFNPKYLSIGIEGIFYKICLLGFADDWGGYEPDYATLAARMGGLKYTPEGVKKITKTLIDMGEIVVYEIEGVEYHWLPEQLDQGIKRANPSTIPLPEWITYAAKKYDSGRTYGVYAVHGDKLPKTVNYTPPVPLRAPVSPVSNKHMPLVKEIVEYLNKKTNKEFKHDTDGTVKRINARLEEGRTLEDFKRVIDDKFKEWANQEAMRKYLQPSTLFGTKFEQYLQACPKAIIKKDVLCKKCNTNKAFTNDGLCTECNGK